jgi:dTDP-4-dehydrorhamnose reductase
MKLFITGADGQLGSEICRLSKHENFGTFLKEHDNITNTNFVQLDITNGEHVFETIKKIKPDWIIHCAAITDVDFCEEHEDIAKSVNVGGTKNLINASKFIRASFLYVSTDFVFDGKNGMYKETDQPNPLSIYGVTKLEGEKIVQELNNHIIARTSVIYSRYENNFVLWLLSKLKAKDNNITIVTDQINSPTLNTELAECILRLIEISARGIYHTAGDERINRFDFSQKIAKIFGLDNSLIKPIKTKQLKQKAIRPLDASLDTSKIKSLGIKFSNVENALKKLKLQIENQKVIRRCVV